MPKNVLHDIMTKEQRSIRQVPLPHKRRGVANTLSEDSILYESEEREEIEGEESPPPLSLRRIILWGASFLFLILLGVALSTSFTGATVSITPKTEQITVNHEFTASKENRAKLRFETLPINESSEIVIPADTTKKVSERATGTIIIYNNFSDKTQRLIKNTRFETKNGLIYRIGASIIVPGKTVKDGRAIPGSIEAIVSADSPGAEYNIQLSDFTIPGFKTDPARFAGFYARSKTPLSGGFDGTVKTPGDKALESARASLKKGLEKKIAEEKQGLVPLGYVLFSGALVAKSESLPIIERGGDQATIREKMIGTAFIFKKEDISRAIAQSVLKSFNNLPVEISNLNTLSFEIKDTTTDDFTEIKTIRFTLKGNAKAAWLYDAAKLKSALMGKQKDELVATLSGFPTIASAELVLRPFWSSSFPTNPKKITIKEVSTVASQKEKSTETE